MQPERVFIDTNILVSAIVFGGNKQKLIARALKGVFIPILSDYIMRETRRIITNNFPAYLHRLDSILEILEYETVDDIKPPLIAKASAIVRDVGDIEVLAAIFASSPDYAITGDKDLLTDEVKSVAPVIRCSEYLELKTDN